MFLIKQVWNDHKLKVRRKLIGNKKESKATGGGPNKMANFSALEESTINILSLDRIIASPGKVFGLSPEEPIASRNVMQLIT